MEGPNLKNSDGPKPHQLEIPTPKTQSKTPTPKPQSHINKQKWEKILTNKSGKKITLLKNFGLWMGAIHKYKLWAQLLQIHTQFISFSLIANVRKLPSILFLSWSFQFPHMCCAMSEFKTEIYEALYRQSLIGVFDHSYCCKDRLKKSIRANFR